MAVVMVTGNAVLLPRSPLDPVRTLTANMALEMAYASGDHRAALFATGIVLFLVIILLNTLAGMVRTQLGKPRTKARPGSPREAIQPTERELAS